MSTLLTCPACKGQPDEAGCSLCHGEGMVEPPPSLKRREPIEAMHACGHLELVESAPCSEQVKAEVRDRVAGTLCPTCRAAATRARQATEREAWRRQESGEEAAPGWLPPRETAEERVKRIQREKELWD